MKEYSRTNFKSPTEAEGVSGIYSKLSVFLDQYTHYYKEADLIIIERQLPTNYKAVRISQHIISYFIFFYRNTLSAKDALIVEVDSKLKSKMLATTKGMNDREVKRWAIEKARELLTMRNDEASLDILDKETKRDDLADVVCQVEAFCIAQNLPLTRKIEQLLL